MRDFLVSRRALITPEQAGLPGSANNRRVPGLRREELASLAGVSVSYYTKLERGDATGVSDTVLGAIARILHLDDAERQHLTELARLGGSPRPQRRRSTAVQNVRPELQRMLDRLSDTPAIIHNARLDILSANELAHAIYADMYARDPRPNIARYTFLQAPLTGSTEEDRGADELVGMLRAAAGHDPYDRQLTDLIGELSTRSDDFRRRWAGQNVRRHASGTGTLPHPEVGPVTLAFESFDVVAEPGLTLKMYSPVDADSEQKLRLLSSWQASRRQAAGADTGAS